MTSYKNTPAVELYIAVVLNTFPMQATPTINRKPNSTYLCPTKYILVDACKSVSLTFSSNELFDIKKAVKRT